MFFTQASYAQGSGSDNSLLIYSLIGLGVVLVIGAILSLTDNLMQVEAKQAGMDTSKENFSLFPDLGSLIKGDQPAHTKGASYKKLKKGFSINLSGKINDNTIHDASVNRYAVRPTNFRGIAPIPKMLVEEGAEVKAGDELFYDKSNPSIKYVAPVSGEVVEVKRGAKRAITEVIILADKDITYRKHEVPSLDGERSAIVDFLMESGAWTHLVQRPFDIVADPTETPKNVFISTFDTSPLALDLNVVVDGQEESFQKGISVLSALTSGSVHLGLNGDKENLPHAAFTGAADAEKHYFAGPHPAGNVGVQMHHTDPINPTDVVWTLKVEDVITIGKLFLTGEYHAERIVGVAGTQVVQPKMYRTYLGASIGDLTADNIADGNNRIISGNVLTGRTVDGDDFLDARSNVVSVIKEGNEHELFGWLLPIKPRPSISKTFPNFLMPGMEFEASSNTHGEKRAFVVTGQYESVLPMDIYPQHLMKSIMANDFERMEGLGLAEMSEEDIALCEFVCTSKMPLQEILREGLDTMRDQM